MTVTIPQVQREFAEFLRLKPNAPALTHLQRALSLAREASDADANTAEGLKTLVDRHVSLVSNEASEVLERFPPGSRSARSQYQFFGTALRLFHDYGYREDKHFVEFYEFLEIMSILEKPSTDQSKADHATMERWLAQRKRSNP